MSEDRELVEKAIAGDLLGPLVSGAEPTVLVPEGYRAIECLGEGGAGVVYLAEQINLRRRVALKFLTNARPADLERFRREARFTARLDNPAIVRIYDLGESGDQPYIAMQYIDGGNLARASLDSRELISVLRDIAVALQHVHREGIVHRDIKPQNILLDRDGKGYITDFGVARDLRHEFGATLGGEGIILGTPELMPPEQARGNLRGIDARSDIYSLGATLYAMLTGQMPFEAANVVDILHSVLYEEPPLPRSLVPSIPRSLEAIVLRCMKKCKTDRYQNMGDVVREFDDYMRGLPGRGESAAWFKKLVGVKPKPPAITETDEADVNAVLEVSSQIVKWDSNLYRVSSNIPRLYPQLDAIIQRLDGMLEQQPGLAWARFYRGVALSRQGRLQEALDDMERSIDRMGDVASAHFEMGRVYLFSHLTASLQARKHIAQMGVDEHLAGTRGRLKQAVLSFEEARRHRGNLPQWQIDYTVAITHFVEQEYEACARACETILEEDPDLEEVWKLHGDALRYLDGDPVESYDRALEIRRTFLMALIAKSEVLFEAGRYDEARKVCERMIEVLPDNPDARTMIGRTHLMEARSESSDETLALGLRFAREAQEKCPDHFEASVTVAELQLEQGRMFRQADSFEGALSEISRAEKLEGCQNRVRLLHATVLLERARHGSSPDAVADLEKVLELGDNPGARLPDAHGWRAVLGEAETVLGTLR